MLKVYCSILILFGIKLTFATFGFDISASCNEFSCLHNTYGAQFMITRAWQSFGAFDSSSIPNLENARSAGIEYTDVYMFPCRGLSASTQMIDLINDLKAGLNGKPVKSRNDSSNLVGAKGLRAGYTLEERNDPNRKKKIKQLGDVSNAVNKTRPWWRPTPSPEVEYGMIWLDIEYNPSSGCSWASYSASSNCQYVQELASTGTSNGASIGIYSSQYEWSVVMGSSSYCTTLTGYPLWYAHYDDSPSFSDYPSVSFGGWKTPAMKQYEGDVVLCNFDIDEDYY